MSVDRAIIAQAFRGIQSEICERIEQLDGKASFASDPWQRAEGGGGLTRVMADGGLIEKGGVNFSEVFGSLGPAAVKALDLPPSSSDGSTSFHATGVSIVLHAHNPWVPTIHMNIRYFETGDGSAAWFGGGIDLTPSYVDEPTATAFHRRLKETCDLWDPTFYATFKRWADDYFFLPHRNETRGIGGIFFDRLMVSPAHSLQHLFGFTCAIGRLFTSLYAEIIAPFRDRPFTQREKNWQMLRRGRYVEFNLAYDRGTRFGLETGGRTESILMSLPPEATWRYDHVPEPGSPEAFTLERLRKGIDRV